MFLSSTPSPAPGFSFVRCISGVRFLNIKKNPRRNSLGYRSYRASTSRLFFPDVRVRLSIFLTSGWRSSRTERARDRKRERRVVSQWLPVTVKPSRESSLCTIYALSAAYQRSSLAETLHRWLSSHPRTDVPGRTGIHSQSFVSFDKSPMIRRQRTVNFTLRLITRRHTQQNNFF